MRPRLRLWGGLRGRLLLALVLTSVVTLGAAAAVVLSPLQQRLRDQSIDSVRAAVLAARPRFENALARRGDDRQFALSREAFELSDQTAGRVLATDLALTPAPGETGPGFLADSESGPPRARRGSPRCARCGWQDTVLIVRGDDVAIAVPLYRGTRVAGAVVARRRLTEVANAVREVQQGAAGGRRRRPAGRGRARGGALQHAAAAARPAARGGAADLRRGADRVDAARHRPRRGRRPRAGARGHAGGAAPAGVGAARVRRHRVARAAHAADDAAGDDGAARGGPAGRAARPHRRAAPGRDRAPRAAAALDPGRGAARPLAARRRGADALRGRRARRARAGGGGGVRAARGRARDRPRAGAAGRRVLGPR